MAAGSAMVDMTSLMRSMGMSPTTLGFLFSSWGRGSEGLRFSPAARDEYTGENVLSLHLIVALWASSQILQLWLIFHLSYLLQHRGQNSNEYLRKLDNCAFGYLLSTNITKAVLKTDSDENHGFDLVNTSMWCFFYKQRLRSSAFNLQSTDDNLQKPM